MDKETCKTYRIFIPHATRLFATVLFSRVRFGPALVWKQHRTNRRRPDEHARFARAPLHPRSHPLVVRAACAGRGGQWIIFPELVCTLLFVHREELIPVLEYSLIARQISLAIWQSSTSSGATARTAFRSPPAQVDKKGKSPLQKFMLECNDNLNCRFCGTRSTRVTLSPAALIRSPTTTEYSPCFPWDKVSTISNVCDTSF